MGPQICRIITDTAPQEATLSFILNNYQVAIRSTATDLGVTTRLTWMADKETKRRLDQAIRRAQALRKKGTLEGSYPREHDLHLQDINIIDGVV